MLVSRQARRWSSNPSEWIKPRQFWAIRFFIDPGVISNFALAWTRNWRTRSPSDEVTRLLFLEWPWHLAKLIPRSTYHYEQPNKLHMAATHDMLATTKFLQWTHISIISSTDHDIAKFLQWTQIVLATIQSNNKCWKYSNSSQKRQVKSSTCCLLSKLAWVRLRFWATTTEKHETLEGHKFPKPLP